MKFRTYIYPWNHHPMLTYRMLPASRQSLCALSQPKPLPQLTTTTMSKATHEFVIGLYLNGSIQYVFFASCSLHYYICVVLIFLPIAVLHSFFVVCSIPLHEHATSWVFLKHFFDVDYCLNSSLSSFMILLQFNVLVFWLQGTWDLSSATRDQTCTLCIGRQSLNH